MSCASSSHTLHTTLRGCCGSSCACPVSVSFSAVKYCPCDDTVTNGVLSYSDGVCLRLASLNNTTYANIDALNTALDVFATNELTTIPCNIPVYIVLTTGGTPVLIGSFVNGVYVPVSPTPFTSFNNYYIYVTSLTNPKGCAKITISSS